MKNQNKKRLKRINAKRRVENLKSEVARIQLETQLDFMCNKDKDLVCVIHKEKRKLLRNLSVV